MQVFDFQFDSQYGVFSDAIVLADDVIISDADLQTMKQARFDNWVSVITAPQDISGISEDVTPTVDAENV